MHKQSLATSLLVLVAIVALFVRVQYLVSVMHTFRVLHHHRPVESLKSDAVVLIYNVTSHVLITIIPGTYSKWHMCNLAGKAIRGAKAQSGICSCHAQA